MAEAQKPEVRAEKKSQDEQRRGTTPGAQTENFPGEGGDHLRNRAPPGTHYHQPGGLPFF